MACEVELNGDGTYVITQNGQPVEGARVKRVSFPSIESHTHQGSVHHIAGPCVATVALPDGSEVENVPVSVRGA
jgi:hypothetical protein